MSLKNKQFYIEQYVPSIFRSKWQEIEIDFIRQKFLASPASLPMYGSIKTPEGFAALNPTQQLTKVSQAVLEVIQINKPTYHRFVYKGGLAETEGTTILVTGMDADTNQVIPAFWDYGDAPAEVLIRFVQSRKVLHMGLTTTFDVLSLEDKPVPQAVVSVVGHLGVEGAFGALGACGGKTPLVITADHEQIGFCWDHRVYDAVQAGHFYQELKQQLNMV